MRYSRIIPDYAANDEEKMRLLRGVFEKIDAFNETEKANKDVRTSTRKFLSCRASTWQLVEIAFPFFCSVKSFLFFGILSVL